MIDTEILQDYSSEARELLEEMDSSLMRVEKEGGSPELLNSIFRAVHCIKGSAEYIGLERSSTLTHGIENLLDRVREGAIGLDAPIIDFLFRAKDLILTLIAEVSEQHQEKSLISNMMQELERFLPNSSVRSAVASEPADEAFLAEQAQSDETSSQEETTFEAPASTSPEETSTGPSAVEEGASQAADQPMGEDDRFYEMFPTESDNRGLDDAKEPPVDMEISASIPQEITTSAEETVVGNSDSEPSLFTAEELRSELRAAAPPGPDVGASLDETVPHILNVSLYLDDLEDGLQPAEVISPIVEMIGSLTEAMRGIGIVEAVGLLESMEQRLSAIPPDIERLSSEEIQHLRGLLHALRPWYPEGLFPLQEDMSSELADVTGTEPSLDESFESSVLRRSLEKIPGLDAAVIEALENAGFTSVEQLALAGCTVP